ncbi:MAG TPA: hypothetical protein VGE96_00555 [Steroidobacteraceae bacterium]|jgi:ElaB/YqjD/DUF883 family membrane-anchored ribosome-binding protein
MMERTAERSAALVDELRNVVIQAEALLQAISADKDEAITVLRDRVSSAVSAAKTRIAEIETQAQVVAQRASIATEAYVRENPWTVVGGAAAVGLILGAAFAHSLAGRGSGARANASTDE